MNYQLDGACGSRMGNRRTNNEDNFYFDQLYLPAQNCGSDGILQTVCLSGEPKLFAVFDGVGGHAGGEQAAFIAAEALAQREQTLPENLSHEELIQLCRGISTAVEQAGEKSGISMGATMALFCLAGESIYACNLGDSKLFRIREGKLAQVSVDHTDERILAGIGLNIKPTLLQYLGMNHREMLPAPNIEKTILRRGDRYLACTDGVTDVLSPEQLFNLAREQGNSSEAVERILDAVAARKGSDDATVLMVAVN